MTDEPASGGPMTPAQVSALRSSVAPDTSTVFRVPQTGLAPLVTVNTLWPTGTETSQAPLPPGPAESVFQG